MALFGFGKKKEEENKEEDKKLKPTKDTQIEVKADKIEEPKKAVKREEERKDKPTPKILTTSVSNYTGVLIKPRITEKATIFAEEGNVYTFNVHPNASKQEVAKAIENNYKIKPIKVNIAPIKRKKVLRRGKVGMKAGGKKAMVYLKKGDKIEFV